MGNYECFKQMKKIENLRKEMESLSEETDDLKKKKNQMEI